MRVQQAEEIVRGLWERDVSTWHAQWVPVFQRFTRDLINDAAEFATHDPEPDAAELYTDVYR